ncbi:MAG: polyprenyl synthetase family protein [Thermodesulfobacteriota bacterium]
MRIQEVIDLVKDDVAKAEESFKKNLNSDVWLVSKVGEYIFSSGGKRFRPLILLLCARLCGYKGESHIPLAAVVEFIHTATLLHDDVVDNANLRRGAKAVNSVWGDGASILVGDYLLSKAFSLAVNNGNERILKVLSQTTTRMAEGEVLQLLKHGDIEITEDEYLNVVTNKTAVLMSASAQVAAILGEASLEKEVALANYGMGLGVAYQLMDDCLDYVSNDKDLGKSVGNDLKEGKVTLPLIHAYEKAGKADKNFLKEAVESDDTDDLTVKEVMSIIEGYGGIRYAIDRAGAYIEGAKKELDLFSPDTDRAALVAVVDYVIERTC